MTTLAYRTHWNIVRDRDLSIRQRIWTPVVSATGRAVMRSVLNESVGYTGYSSRILSYYGKPIAGFKPSGTNRVINLFPIARLEWIDLTDASATSRNRLNLLFREGNTSYVISDDNAFKLSISKGENLLSFHGHTFKIPSTGRVQIGPMIDAIIMKNYYEKMVAVTPLILR